MVDIEQLQRRRWELHDATGAVVVIDVLRAFTTAAYAFAGGAASIYVVRGVEEALAFKQENPMALAMGEDRGRRPDGFDLSNSPAAVRRAGLDGRTIVQRTSAGTQGIFAADRAARRWAGSLVVASATAAAVNNAGCGDPIYVITGCFEDRPELLGGDDRATASFIEEVRRGGSPNADDVARSVLVSPEAVRTLSAGAGHADPADIELAVAVDAFDFAMEVEQDSLGTRLVRRD